MVGFGQDIYLFTEERMLRQRLHDEMKEGILKAVNQAAGLFSRKGNTRDRRSAVWNRLQFPWGFLTVVTQKLNRLPAMLECLDSDGCEIPWEAVEEELMDIALYCFIMISLLRMLKKREE